MDHSCDEDDFNLRVLHDGRGYDHLVKNRVSRGIVSQDVWLEEIRTFGGQQTVMIVGVKTVPVVGLLSSTFAPTTNKADSAKEELDIFSRILSRMGGLGFRPGAEYTGRCTSWWKGR